MDGGKSEQRALHPAWSCTFSGFCFFKVSAIAYFFLLRFLALPRSGAAAKRDLRLRNASRRDFFPPLTLYQFGFFGLPF